MFRTERSLNGSQEISRYRSTTPVNLAQDPIQRFERVRQLFRPANMQQPVSSFQECEVVALLRSSAKSVAKPLHVGTPNFLRGHVDQEFKRQWFLVVEL